MPSFRDGSSASLEEAKMAWRDLISIWHPDRHNGNKRLRRKAEEKTKQLNEAWETFQTRSAGKRKQGAKLGDLRERFREKQESREQGERQARDKKERKRVESNENQESKKLATKSNAVKFPTIRFLWGILLYLFVKVIDTLLIITTLYYTYETQAE